MAEQREHTITTTVRLTREAHDILRHLTIACGEHAMSHMVERLIREEAFRRGLRSAVPRREPADAEAP